MSDYNDSDEDHSIPPHTNKAQASDVINTSAASSGSFGSGVPTIPPTVGFTFGSTPNFPITTAKVPNFSFAQPNTSSSTPFSFGTSNQSKDSDGSSFAQANPKSFGFGATAAPSIPAFSFGTAKKNDDAKTTPTSENHQRFPPWPPQTTSSGATTNTNKFSTTEKENEDGEMSDDEGNYSGSDDISKETEEGSTSYTSEGSNKMSTKQSSQCEMVDLCDSSSVSSISNSTPSTHTASEDLTNTEPISAPCTSHTKQFNEVAVATEPILLPMMSDRGVWVQNDSATARESYEGNAIKREGQISTGDLLDNIIGSLQEVEAKMLQTAATMNTSKGSVADIYTMKLTDTDISINTLDVNESKIIVEESDTLRGVCEIMRAEEERPSYQAAFPGLLVALKAVETAAGELQTTLSHKYGDTQISRVMQEEKAYRHLNSIMTADQDATPLQIAQANNSINSLKRTSSELKERLHVAESELMRYRLMLAKESVPSFSVLYHELQQKRHSLQSIHKLDKAWSVCALNAHNDGIEDEIAHIKDRKMIIEHCLQPLKQTASKMELVSEQILLMMVKATSMIRSDTMYGSNEKIMIEEGKTRQLSQSSSQFHTVVEKHSECSDVNEGGLVQLSSKNGPLMPVLCTPGVFLRTFEEDDNLTATAHAINDMKEEIRNISSFMRSTAEMVHRSLLDLQGDLRNVESKRKVLEVLIKSAQEGRTDTVCRKCLSNTDNPDRAALSYNSGSVQGVPQQGYHPSAADVGYKTIMPSGSAAARLLTAVQMENSNLNEANEKLIREKEEMTEKMKIMQQQLDSLRNLQDQSHKSSSPKKRVSPSLNPISPFPGNALPPMEIDIMDSSSCINALTTMTTSSHMTPLQCILQKQMAHHEEHLVKVLRYISKALGWSVSYSRLGESNDFPLSLTAPECASEGAMSSSPDCREASGNINALPIAQKSDLSVRVDTRTASLSIVYDAYGAINNSSFALLVLKEEQPTLSDVLLLVAKDSNSKDDSLYILEDESTDEEAETLEDRIVRTRTSIARAVLQTVFGCNSDMESSLTRGDRDPATMEIFIRLEEGNEPIPNKASSIIINKTNFTTDLTNKILSSISTSSPNGSMGVAATSTEIVEILTEQNQVQRDRIIQAWRVELNLRQQLDKDIKARRVKEEEAKSKWKEALMIKHSNEIRVVEASEESVRENEIEAVQRDLFKEIEKQQKCELASFITQAKSKTTEGETDAAASLDDDEMDREQDAVIIGCKRPRSGELDNTKTSEGVMNSVNIRGTDDMNISTDTSDAEESPLKATAKNSSNVTGVGKRYQITTNQLGNIENEIDPSNILKMSRMEQPSIAEEVIPVSIEDTPTNSFKSPTINQSLAQEGPFRAPSSTYDNPSGSHSDKGLFVSSASTEREAMLCSTTSAVTPSASNPLIESSHKEPLKFGTFSAFTAVNSKTESDNSDPKDIPIANDISPQPKDASLSPTMTSKISFKNVPADVATSLKTDDNVVFDSSEKQDEMIDKKGDVVMDEKVDDAEEGDEALECETENEQENVESGTFGGDFW